MTSRWMLAVVLAGGLCPMSAWPGASSGDGPGTDAAQQVEAGRRIYREGVLLSGDTITGIVEGDVPLTGKQVVCGQCHRRSGMGAAEGQDVAPAVVGDILYEPLRLPTVKPPLPPELRPAYTDETLKRAIRSGIAATGQPLGPLMPRYPLGEDDLDALIAYLKTLSSGPDPGVTERDIHFATIVSDSADAHTRKAFLDVFETYFTQKNRETRHETERAEHAPWHKAWTMGTYRKWVLHVWELKGSPDTWPAQLQTLYDQQPVFAVLSGLVGGGWKPIHGFCEAMELPCLFPVTDLPVSDEEDFYNLYFSRGMALEADAIADHLAASGLITKPLLQVYREGDLRAEAAAAAFRASVAKAGGQVQDLALDGPGPAPEGFWSSALAKAAGGTSVLWVDQGALGDALSAAPGAGPQRVYLSTTLYGTEPGHIAPEWLSRVFVVHPQEVPDRTALRVARAVGWLKGKHIYDPEALRAQADAVFALRVAGEAVKSIRGYFRRDLVIERIEHMVDNAPYTSVYPSLSLSPGQRFASKGVFIAQFSAEQGGKLTAVSPWLIPGSSR